MDDVTSEPKLPPAWFMHTFWRAHRALYRLLRLAHQAPRPVRARAAVGAPRNGTA